MRFFHLSDLHLGKTVHEFSMLEEQAHVLKDILAMADRERPQCVLIAGDVFDRGVAPAEALRLFDDFLVGLNARGIQAYVISGNHDSADRLAHGARLIAPSGIHIAPGFTGQMTKHSLRDEHGEIDLFLLPFIRPAMVRKAFPDKAVDSWTDAVRVVIEAAAPDPMKRNVLLCHQFITGGVTSESEEFSVGGADNVDAGVFAPFDYVALGHLHRPQRIGRDSLRYCGSSLKYSFSEAGHQKTITRVDMGPKGEVSISQLPLTPLRDLVEIRGSFHQLSSPEYFERLNLDHYYRITLTDEEDQPDAIHQLRKTYPRLMRLDYDNARTREQASLMQPADKEALTPLSLFETLYEAQNNLPLTEEQQDYLISLIDQLKEDMA